MSSSKVLSGATPLPHSKCLLDSLLCPQRSSAFTWAESHHWPKLPQDSPCYSGNGSSCGLQAAAGTHNPPSCYCPWMSYCPIPPWRPWADKGSVMSPAESLVAESLLKNALMKSVSYGANVVFLSEAKWIGYCYEIWENWWFFSFQNLIFSINNIYDTLYKCNNFC